MAEAVEFSLDWLKLDPADELCAENLRLQPAEQACSGYQAADDCRLEGCWTGMAEVSRCQLTAPPVEADETCCAHPERKSRQVLPR